MFVIILICTFARYLFKRRFLRCVLYINYFSIKKFGLHATLLLFTAWFCNKRV